MKKIAVLVSGGGTNLQALIDAEARGEIKNGKISLVLASNDQAYALKRAENHNIPSVVVSKKECANEEEFAEKLLNAFKEHNIDVIVLAGYLSIIPKAVVEKYPHRILNIHPSLIPSFCGGGYYGLKVHEAALAKGVKVTGATVHFVNEIYDDGEIIIQKAVLVKEGDTPEILQKRVMEEAEWKILPQAVSLVCEDRVEVKNNITIIKEN